MCIVWVLIKLVDVYIFDDSFFVLDYKIDVVLCVVLYV